MGNLSGESREQNRKDKVTRFRSVTYGKQLGLLVNTLGSHLKLDFGTQVVLLPSSTARLAVLHGSSSTWFQTSCYRCAELNS